MSLGVKISASIMSHPDRAYYSERLMWRLNSMPFHSVSLVFDDGRGEWSTGERALRSHTDSEWHVVIQDDAIISKNFYEQVVESIEKAPQRTLISFYIGTIRPAERKITASVRLVESNNASWILANDLLWGVGFAIPTEDIEPMLEYVSLGRKYRELPYDKRIGVYYKNNKRGVLYTYPSFVNHDYTIGSLLATSASYDKEPRVAHYYEMNKVEMNNKVVEINV